MPDRVEVRCYAGGRGEETPRSLLLEGRELLVWVERGWVEQPAAASGTERRRVFQVSLPDGHRPRLAQEPDGDCTLTYPGARSTAGGAATSR
jgi:hypothetical protein